MKKANKDPNPTCRNKPTSINGLKFASINISSIRGKQLELVAFPTATNPSAVAIQKKKKMTKQSPLRNSSRNRVHTMFIERIRNLHGGSVTLLINKELSHMPL